MADLVFAAVLFVFSAATWGFLRLCVRLQEEKV